MIGWHSSKCGERRRLRKVSSHRISMNANPSSLLLLPLLPAKWRVAYQPTFNPFLLFSVNPMKRERKKERNRALFGTSVDSVFICRYFIGNFIERGTVDPYDRIALCTPPIYLGGMDLHTLSFFPSPTPLALFLSLAMLTNTLFLPTRQGGPHGQTESGGRVLAVNAGARAPRGGVA